MGREVITSAQNPKIKELLALQEKSRLRREKGLFVVEGRRELEHCLNAGFRVRTVFVCPEILPIGDLFPDQSPLCAFGLRPHPSQTEVWTPPVHEATGGYGLERETDPEKVSVIEVSRAVYEKIAYREGTEGIVAEVYAKGRRLEDLRLSDRPLVVVLEAVEKPGNLGAVLRSADAAGADAVIVCAVCSSEEAIGWLKARGIRIYTAQLQDSEWYYDTDMTGGTAIVMGTEATGLTDIWRQAADAHIRIPMLGQLDSLNVSVSAAILLFEAVRQRNSATRK